MRESQRWLASSKHTQIPVTREAFTSAKQTFSERVLDMKPTSSGGFGKIIRWSSARTLYNAQMASSTTPRPELEEHLDARQRWISLAEFALGASIVILHNVYHRVPNEVPILFVLGWISIRLRNG